MSMFSRRSLGIAASGLVLVAGVVVLAGQSSAVTAGVPSAPEGTARVSAVDSTPAQVSDSEDNRSVLMDRFQPTFFLKAKGTTNK